MIRVARWMRPLSELIPDRVEALDMVRPKTLLHMFPRLPQRLTDCNHV